MKLFNEYPDFQTAWDSTEFRVVMGGMGDDTSMLIAELYSRGYEPDEIVFCDTSSEMPHTYQFIEYLKTWCELMNWSKVVVLNKVDRYGEPLSVIELCENNQTLPAAAFGMKSCSLRFKTETADKYFNNHPSCWKAWGVTKKGVPLDKHTGSILRIVGINADEPERSNAWSPQDKWVQVFPLIEWDIGYFESKAVTDVGLYYPGKSSCICCPHLTGGELIMIRDKYPDEFERIKNIELSYQLNKTKNDGPRGLCRKDTIDEKIDKYIKRGGKSDADVKKCSTCIS